MADVQKNALAGRPSGEAPDDWNRLASSVPALHRNLTGDLNALHSWITLNMLDPARYAGMYPVRVLSRYMDPTGQDQFYNPQPRGVRMDQVAAVTEGFRDAVARGGRSYEPGPRESENVEIRVPKSIWEY